jgi:hypothetical protein
MKSRNPTGIVRRLFSFRDKPVRSGVALILAAGAAAGVIILVISYVVPGPQAQSGQGAGAPASRSTAGGPCTAPRNAPDGPDPWGGCWPGPDNTGVPVGTVLKNVPQDVSSGSGWNWNATDGAIYVTGCNVVLDGLNVNGDIYLRSGNGTQSAATPCLTIKNSKINGFIDVDDYCLIKQCGPLVMTDDEIALPGSADRSSLGLTNWYAWRINSHGGHGTLACDGHCEVHDSWIHGFYLERSFHYNAVGSNGDGAGPFVVDHNYLSCGDFWAENPDTNGSAGCSADLGLYGDFGAIANVTITRNYFAPAAVTNTFRDNYQPSYCINTNNPQPGKPHPDATNEVVTDNVFARGHDGKCGVYGPVSSWQSGGGNIWRGNKWDDGTPLELDSQSGG